MEGNTEIQTGDVFENGYMRIVVTQVTENKITYSAGSVETTHTVLKSKFELKILSENFEKVDGQGVSENAEVANPVVTDGSGDSTEQKGTNPNGGTRQMISSSPFYDRSTKTAMEGKGPLSW